MIKLGQQVTDRVTGFTGIATSRLEYLNGCVQFGVTPKAKKGAIARPAAEWIDEGNLEVSGSGVAVKKRDTGGPVPNAPKAYRG